MDAPQAPVTQAEAAQRSPKRRKIDGAENAGPGAPAGPAPEKPAAPAASTGAATQNGNSKSKGGQQQKDKEQQQQQGKKPKKVPTDPMKALFQHCTHGIFRCAKTQDLAAALALLDEAEGAGLALQAATYNTMLYLAVGGDRWEVLVRGGDPDTCAKFNASGDADPAASAAAEAAAQPPAVSKDKAAEGAGEAPASSSAPVGPEALQRHMDAAVRVWGVMQARGVKPDGGTYLALARMEGLRRDPDAALDWVLKAKAANTQLQLRMFHPALVGYCMARSAEAVLRVLRVIGEQGLENLDLTEYEYARGVEALAADPAARWADMRDVLGRMAKELNELSAPTLDLVRAFFATSPGGARALAEDGEADPAGSGITRSRWHVEAVQVGASGECEAAGGKLARVELEEEEWESFAEGVASLAQRDERGKTDFAAYMEWLRRNGPYDVMIDAANVAFYGQNRAGGGFNWGQIRRMVDVAKRAHPGAKVLVMVHRKRLFDPEAKSGEVQRFIEGLKAQKAFYYTPPGSNDDWYWMYAAVRARSRGMLISNDELRDHIFTLLRPKHFLKWKAGHITHYSFPGPDTEPQLLPPPSYTSCVQRLDSGAWMFPSQEQGKWLCVRPM